VSNPVEFSGPHPALTEAIYVRSAQVPRGKPARSKGGRRSYPASPSLTATAPRAARLTTIPLFGPHPTQSIERTGLAQSGD
jgi:hypothetical protein